MSASKRQMKLGTFLSSSGEHVAAWRHPDNPPHDRADFDEYLQAARVAEAALFDMILVADVVPSNDTPLDALVYDASIERLDPYMLSAALAVSTKRIGIVATGSTSFEQPYHIARRIASLDHLGKGRGGWNCVTTSNSSLALNFNQERHLAPAERYDRAEEFVDIVRGLWDSWDDDAFLRDQKSGRYFRADGLHVLDHKGDHFSVRGPLDAVRSKQGRPVIVQAGSSGPGRDLGARVADVLFTTHPNLKNAQAFYTDVKQRGAHFGRAADEVLVLLALMPVVGATRSEAQEKMAELDSLIPASVALARLESRLGDIDLTCYPQDQPLPDDLPLGNGMQSRRQSVIDLGKRDSLTIAQLAAKVAGNRGHWSVVGTAKDVADEMEAWFTQGGADGYLLVPPRTPQSLQEFAAHVVPELQKRGLFRTAYEGQTLRQHLGLRHPARGEELAMRPEKTILREAAIR